MIAHHTTSQLVIKTRNNFTYLCVFPLLRKYVFCHPLQWNKKSTLTDLPSWFLPHILVSKFYGYLECELGSHSMVWLKVRQPIKWRLYLLLENIMDPARIHVDKKGCRCDRQICKLDAETSVRWKSETQFCPIVGIFVQICWSRCSWLCALRRASRTTCK